MSRTRIVFFGVLAIFLALIAVGLGADLVDPHTLQQLFVAATVFAGGVVLLDMFGLLGHHGDTADDGGSLAGHTGDLGGSLEHTGGDFAAGQHVTGDYSTGDHAAAAGNGVHGGAHDAGGHDGHGHDNSDAGAGHAAAVPIISALTYLRLVVYFCLGFGPVGWITMSNGRPPLVSLVLASLVGVGAVFLAQWFFRLQRKDTDSQVMPEDLLASDATVIVPLDATNMGKVRVKTGVNVEDLYALAADPDCRFEKGAAVRIARVTDECVYVR